jgi:NADH dehydrogenase
MVYGGPEVGLFGNLCGLVRRLPVLPALFLPMPMVQPIHVDDLSAALVAVTASDPAPKSLYEIADPHPISLTAFLRIIAHERVHKRRLFFPVPAIVLKSILACLFRLTRKAAIDPARLNSLLGMRIMNSASSNAELGLSPRDIADGMHPNGSRRRRGLIREGRSLIKYLSGAYPARAMIARYVRVVERFDGGKSLEFPSLLHTWPALLWLIEGPRLGGRNVHVMHRIDIAFQITEASILTHNFELARQVPWPLVVLHLTAQLIKELTGIGLRSIFGRWLHFDPNSRLTVDR